MRAFSGDDEKDLLAIDFHRANRSFGADFHPRPPSPLRERELEIISKPMAAFSTVSIHYLFTPTLTLPLKGEGTFEIVS